MSEKIELLGLSKEELAAEIEKLGEKPFRAKQLWQWIYNRGVGDFAEMSNLSKDFREKLSAGYAVTRPKIVAEQVSVDKTHKWLLEFSDGQRVEMVYSRRRPRCCLYFDPGRLRGGLHILPYRFAKTDPQPDCRRDCRAIYGCPRRLSRMAKPF